MLMEKRFQEILRILEEQGTVSVQDLTESLDASEATIRRDLSQLAQMGKLKKIYGGAASLETGYQTREIRVEERQELYVEEKKQIAKYAASLIEPGDFVYVDAGSSTEYLVEYIEERDLLCDEFYVTCFEAGRKRHESQYSWRQCEGNHGSSSRSRCYGNAAAVSFHQGLLGSGRNPQEGRLYHAGDGRSSGETAVHETDQGMLCAL